METLLGFPCRRLFTPSRADISAFLYRLAHGPAQGFLYMWGHHHVALHLGAQLGTDLLFSFRTGRDLHRTGSESTRALTDAAYTIPLTIARQ